MRIVPRSAPTLRFEQQLWATGLSHIAGVDEVGRGALAGPIVTAMVVFAPSHSPIPGVKDSKLVSAKQRLLLEQEIKAQAVSWSIGVGDIDTINTLGIVPALHDAVIASLTGQKWEHVLIDGLPLKPIPKILEQKATFIVKGDQLSYSIAAASILAKVYRDSLMTALSQEFPEYGWHQNVGYGTQVHRTALKQYGLTPHHRTSFIHLERD